MRIPDHTDLQSLLVEIAHTYMPFGIYGPAKYPPHGCPLMDVPVEYLTWFKQKGFPKGKLGLLMEECWNIRANDMDCLFDPFRKARGGRTNKSPKRKSFEF